MGPVSILLLVLAVIGVIAALYRLITGQWLKSMSSKSWPYTPATIETGKVTEFHVRGTTQYDLDATYSYSVSGAKYSGTYRETFQSESAAQSMLESLQKMPPPARYSPGNPARSAIDPYRDAALAFTSSGESKRLGVQQS
jgi:hypothetical protein